MGGETLYTYELEPCRTRLSTRVLDQGVTSQPWAVLSDTLFYPEGGGQPSDQGRLGNAQVLAVRRRQGVIVHYLDRSVPIGEVELQLDWTRRFDHMQQHTGQHLLSALALDRFGWPTTAFHLGREQSDIEVETPLPVSERLDELEEAVAGEIRAARPITARRVSAEQLARIQVRSRGLPEGHTGSIRLVEIEGIDVNTCGGTHLASTAEVESLKILGAESLRGGTRIFYVAGRRVRGCLGRHEERNSRLRKLLATGDDRLAATVGLKLEELKQALRRQRALESDLASAVAEMLASRAGPLVETHFEGMGMRFLQRVQREFSRRRTDCLLFLTSQDSQDENPGAIFLLVAGSELGLNLTSLGGQVTEVLRGRGGGSGRIFQGKATSLKPRAKALAVLSQQVVAQPRQDG